MANGYLILGLLMRASKGQKKKQSWRLNNYSLLNISFSHLPICMYLCFIYWVFIDPSVGNPVRVRAHGICPGSTDDLGPY